MKINVEDKFSDTPIAGRHGVVRSTWTGTDVTLRLSPDEFERLHGFLQSLLTIYQLQKSDRAVNSQLKDNDMLAVAKLLRALED